MRFLTWLSIIAIVTICCRCSGDDDMSDLKEQSKIMVYTSGTSESKAGEYIVPSQQNTLLFTGNDILWYNESTEEIKFKDGPMLKKFQENWASYHYATFCLENEQLFTVFISKSMMSYIHDDLTLIDVGGYKYYLSDGYPNSGYGNPLKKEKRTEAWEKFIDQLKAEGRYKK